MLEELRGEVLPRHRAAVDEELSRLDATVARHWGDSVDLDRASRGDGQGIGGGRTSSPGEPPLSPADSANRLQERSEH